MTSSNNKNNEQECLHESWMNLQHAELRELEQAAAANRPKDEQKQTQLIEKIIKHFQDYCTNRSRLAQKDVSPFFAPTSCTPLENSVLWICGCRPSSFIRLIFTLFCGVEIESYITQFLQGITRNGEIHEFTAKQMNMVDELQSKTIREERKLSSRLANCENADEPLDKYNKYMAAIMEEADELRMKTLKEIVVILEPDQAVEYLAAAKKIRLCIQQWGKKRDHDNTNSCN
ncbi:PREDICTED: protein DOG1-like 3 [Nicotiana attenuata]|uniref:protein DOG1-like 3 n=1 Tax=Nicotiana attenuata TaxID=49451 RepID=UPI0009054739|nr:PREDICTED: protein DOG1-like 3 [Nicotiana attenuata]